MLDQPSGCLASSKTPCSTLRGTFIKKLFLTVLVCSITGTTLAATEAFKGPDFCGLYNYKGKDNKEALYTAVVTPTLNKTPSTGKSAANDFKMGGPGDSTYLGQAAGQDRTLAIQFALTDPSIKHHRTGVATVTVKNGKTGFHKYYYEPQFNGDNYCTEDCLKR